MSPKPGTFSWLLVVSSCSKPPNTTIEPSSTSTLDSIERLLVIRPKVGELLLSMLLTSWKICILIVPFSLIWGLTRSVRPTSLRSTV